MMAVVMQLVSFLSILISITVCDDVFKLVNSSVQLEVKKKVDSPKLLIWSFGKMADSDYIVKYIPSLPSEVYRSKDKVEFNEETHSLTLKNLQKNDSGLYHAVAADKMTEIVAAYQLYVLDPVGKPVLNVSHQQHPETCNVTLTCGAQNLSITSYCYNDNCNMKEEITAEGVSLSFSFDFSNSIIVCNHSNPVSWETTTMEMKHVKQLCPFKAISMHTYCIL
ncbi:uncharacterized protein LOC128513302 [Clarias gariepinus]|uniref:uncharacterized protein LOC128513302 n=1 Tax=Clarias gariepinus TaxID=13013 RepID=UPI00234CD71B|nr:uncharacterized protein LOC128513302 [Clarias gariepinus]